MLLLKLLYVNKESLYFYTVFIFSTFLLSFISPCKANSFVSDLSGNAGKEEVLILLNPEAKVEYTADDYMQVYVDTSGTITFNEIEKNKVKFLPKEAILTDIQPGYQYWIKLRLRNNLWWDAMFIFFPGKWDNVELYQVTENNVSTKKTGYLVPLNQRDQPKRTPQFEILTRKGQEQTIFLRASNKINTSRKSSYKASLHYRSYYFEQQIADMYLQGCYAGILMAMVLYNFIIFMMMKDKSYLYYVLTSAFFLLYWITSNGFAFEHIWPTWLYWDKVATFYLISGFLIFYIFFTKSFLGAARLHPAYNKLFSVLFALITGCLVLALLQVYAPLNILLPVLAILTTCIIVGSSVSAIMKGYKPAIYFLMANSMQLAGAIIYGFMFMGLFPENTITLHAMPVGSILQSIFFSASLANRINVLNKEVADMALAKEKVEREKETESKLQIELSKIELERQIAERTTELRQKTYELEIKNKDIIDSIIYAKKIQEAILPDIHKLKEILPKHFVLHKPKDIVSGDFYWFTTVEKPTNPKKKKTDQTLIIAVADCIGHGVPGAFMSIIGAKLLDQIVNINKVTTPSQILTLLHEEVVKSLNQDAIQDMKAKEGMDIALLSIDFSSNTIVFAGAKRPLYFVKHNELYEIRGENFTIGGFTYGTTPVFQDHLFTLEEGTAFYLTSDGFADQFGGNNYKKFMSKNFKKKLISISHLEKEIQKEELDEAFEQWKGNHNQIDDVLVVGIGF